MLHFLGIKMFKKKIFENFGEFRNNKIPKYIINNRNMKNAC